MFPTGYPGTYILNIGPWGYRTFHFVSFLYVFFFSFLFLLFRFFSRYFVLRFFTFRFFSFLFVTFLLVFFSFFFFPFLFVFFRFFPFLSLQVPGYLLFFIVMLTENYVIWHRFTREKRRGRLLIWFIRIVLWYNFFLSNSIYTLLK